MHSFSVRSPTYVACDTFTALHLQFPSGASCSANVAFSNYFEVSLKILQKNSDLESFVSKPVKRSFSLNSALVFQAL